MAAVPASELTPAARDELLVTYAAMILHDEQSDLSAENLNAVLKAAGAKVDAYWPAMFAKLCEKKSIGEYIEKAGTAGGAAAGAAPAEAKKEEPEEEEEDMDFDLFG